MMTGLGDIGIVADNLVAALVLGGLIGTERQWRQRLAGLRTNTLVALGAAPRAWQRARPPVR